MYDIAKWGEIPEDLWVDCVVASNVDPSLAPEGTHVMTCFVQYVPYELREGTWDRAARHCWASESWTRWREYAPNVPGAVTAMHVVTPLDLERTYGLTEGNIFHGDLNIEQLFFMRPVPGYSNYRTPVDGLYLCGAGVHPGGGVTGAPGYVASHKVLARREEASRLARGGRHEAARPTRRSRRGRGGRRASGSWPSRRCTSSPPGDRQRR